MIPSAYITEWRQFAPWVDDAQVEQDLILCRAIVSIYRNPFDLWLGFRHEAVRPQQVMEIFQHYLRADGRRVTQRELEENLADKRSHPDFAADLGPLLANSVEYDFEEAFDFVSEVLLKHFPKH